MSSQTPTKRRVVGHNGTRSGSNTPTGARKPAVATAKASSEVRQALLALKAKQGTERAKPTRGLSEYATSTEEFAGSSARANQDDAEEGFGPNISSIVEKAKATGRLILASRSLQSIPGDIYASFISPTHSLHPSNKAPPSFFKQDKMVDLSISREDSETASTRWYEQLPLSILKLSNNEITAVDEELGGLVDLENLDLHCNLFKQIPLSLANLVNLTVLNLSSNRFDNEIPLALLSLDNLVSLDLSNNKLKSLWSKEWKTSLKDLLTSSPDDPDASFESISSAGGDFWSTFPSSPVKQRSSSNIPSNTNAPFPCLRTLNLSHNRLQTSSLDELDLPPSLTHLDLSSNALTSSLPTQPFLQLLSLDILSLASNDLSDHLFLSVPEPFLPSLTSLDISNNAFDGLEHIDRIFAHSAKKISYLGIPPTLGKLLKPVQPNTETAVLQIRIAGNILRGEPARRRKLNERPLVVLPVPVQNRKVSGKSMGSAESWKTAAEDGDDGLLNEIKGLSVEDAAASFPFLDQVDMQGNLKLGNTNLEEFPSGRASNEPKIKTVDLSKNALVHVPFAAFASWGPVFSAMSSLNLARNRIASLQDASPFLHLESLDLSANRLALPTLFQDLARIAPQLAFLDLTYNMLNTLEGLDGLLLRESGGLQSLKLSGNRLADLQPLVEIALRVKNGESRKWKCSELDVRDNEISKLPPELGYLPLDSLQVEGNTFRIPTRRIWESGGTSGLLKWLKDKNT